MRILYITVMTFFLSGCASQTSKNYPPIKVITVGNVQKSLEKVKDKTLVIFTLDSLLDQQQETLILKECISDLSRAIDSLQQRRFKVLLLDKLHSLYNLLGQADIELLKSYGYDFEKSWIGLKDYNFDYSLFTKGGLFFETIAELDYWTRIEHFIKYANIEITKVILVHEPDVGAIEDYRYKKNPLRNIATEYIAAETLSN